MSADVLRQAAALMRESVEAASEGPWYAVDSSLPGRPNTGAWCIDSDLRMVGDTGYPGDPLAKANAEYIASWHPAVALAVADWLDREADLYERLETMRLEVSKKGFEMSWGESTQDEALAVARAYLGESA